MKYPYTDSEIRSEEIYGLPNNGLILHQPHISKTTARMNSEKGTRRSQKATVAPFEQWGP